MKEQLAAGGLRFPHVILFTDGQNYWFGDGYHRVLAAAKAGLTEIAADVRPGNQRDAMLFAISANSAHGLPRTSADKRKAVAVLLGDSEWKEWSDRDIARRCLVSNSLVSRMRQGASVTKTQMRERKVCRNGTVYEMTLPSRSALETQPANGAEPNEVVARWKRKRVRINLAFRFAVSERRRSLPLPTFERRSALCAELASLLDRIARGPGGELYRQEMLRTSTDGRLVFACTGLQICRNKLLGAEPYCGYCPNCYSTHPARPYPGCKKCGGRGWTTRAAFEGCAETDRHHLLSMRSI